MFQTKAVEENKVHIVCLVNIFENRGFYMIMCKNYVERGRPPITIWRMRIACCIAKTTKHTFTICNTYCFSTATMVAQARLNITLYILGLSCLVFLKTGYRYNNVFAICDNHATSCSF